MTQPRRMPMFPLGSVLIPGAGISLHVFEPRFRVLVFDCLRSAGEFGVVLIERGFEVGGHDQRFSVGTAAGIAEAIELPDGRWALHAVGQRRIEVIEWLPDDPYPVALVHELADEPWSAAANEALTSADRGVQRALGMAAALADSGLAGGGQAAVFELADDPATAGWQLVAMAPLGALDKQGLLLINDPAERLRRLATLAEEKTILFAYRLDQE